MVLKLGWFATSKGQTSLKIFNFIHTAILNKELDVEIKFVFVNRDIGEGENSDIFISTIKNLKIPVVTFSSKNFLPELRKTDLVQWREKFDSEVYEKIKKYDVDIIMLAGYMLVLSKVLCNNFTVINLHPALPWGPKGTWQEVINEIIEKKYTEHGVMIHIVTEELDCGPVLTYCKFNINPMVDSFDKIREQGVKYELPLVKKTLQLLSEKKFEIKERKIYSENKILKNGYEIDIKYL